MIANEAPESPDTGSDPLADDGEMVRNIRTCEALHEARLSFQSALVEGAAIQKGSAIQNRHFAASLRQDSIYQMAEFFFLLRAFGIEDDAKIRRYAEVHNLYIEELQKDKTKRIRLGLSPTRVEKGMFSQDCISKLVENYRTHDGAIDQSDLSRLLIQVMSPETCRKTVVTLTKAGYLERWSSPYQAKLVRSTGTLERLFARSMRHVRSALASLAGTLEPDDVDRDDDRHHDRGDGGGRGDDGDLDRDDAAP